MNMSEPESSTYIHFGQKYSGLHPVHTSATIQGLHNRNYELPEFLDRTPAFTLDLETLVDQIQTCEHNRVERYHSFRHTDSQFLADCYSRGLARVATPCGVQLTRHMLD